MNARIFPDGIKMNNTLLGQFLKKPLTTGAVCASSESLAKELTNSIGLETAGSAAELGPGTGAVTKVILGRIPENAVSSRSN